MWTPTTRRQHSRAGLRYETDLTDAEWAVIAPLMPEPAPCGRPPVWTTREVLNAIFYVLRGGIAWRLQGELRMTSGPFHALVHQVDAYEWSLKREPDLRAQAAAELKPAREPELDIEQKLARGLGLGL